MLLYYKTSTISLIINGLTYLGSALATKEKVLGPRPPGELLSRLNGTVTSQPWPLDAMHNMNSEILYLFIFFGRMIVP